MKLKHFLLVVFTVIFNLPFSQLNAQNIRADSSMHTGNIYHLGGNVGIGTTNPFHDLSIKSFTEAGDTSCIRLENSYSATKGGYSIWDIDNEVDKLVFKYTNNPLSYANTKVLTIFPKGNVSIGTQAIDNSAILQLESKSMGVLIPRMTNAEINNIPNPAQGLLVFSTDDNNFKYFYGQIETWQTIPNLSEINTLLSNYVTTTDLTNTLNDYSTTTEINTLLSNYVTITDLTNTLNDYSTTTEINTLLSNYVTITDLTTTLNDYSTTADIVATYLSIDDFNTIIADYAQTSDLDNYLTTSEIQANYVPNHSDYTNSIFTTDDNGDLVYLQAGNQGQVLTVNNEGYFSWTELPSASESIWSRSGYNIFTKSYNNNVGIGFSDYHINDFYPQTKLHIFNIIENDAQQTTTSSLRIEEYDKNIGFFKAWDIQNNNGDLFFAYSNSTDFEKKIPSSKITFSSDGFVGINTTAPEYFLDVNGRARIMGDLTFGVNVGIHKPNWANISVDQADRRFDFTSPMGFTFNSNNNEVASISSDGDFTATNANINEKVFIGTGTTNEEGLLNLNSNQGSANGIFVTAGYSGAHTTLLKLQSVDHILAMFVSGSGSVGIGTDNIPSGYKFAVAGGLTATNANFSENITTPSINSSNVDVFSITANSISFNTNGSDELAHITNDGHFYCRELIVQKDGGFFPDYVFEPDYDLMPLTELEDYVITNKHLPDVPTAQDVDANGIPVGDLSTILLKKVEELTLYTIEQDKNITALQQIIEQQQLMIQQQQQAIQQLIDNQNNDN